MADESDEVSFGGELTETGAKVTIKSRTVAALDRLGGALWNRRRAPIDAEVAEANARSDARVKVIDAIGELAIEKLKNNPEFAAQAIEGLIPTLVRRQENKEAILELAIEDLRENPGTTAEAETGPEKLDDQFLNRFERYAEDATEERVRERWAKVLASEIRKPGTFSGKALRTIDELDSETAQMFERVSERIAGGAVWTALGDLQFNERTELSNAGLLVQSDTGHVRFATETEFAGGRVFLWAVSDLLVAIDCDAERPVSIDAKVLKEGQVPPTMRNTPAIPIRLLTAEGRAIAAILPDQSNSVAQTLAAKLAEASPTSRVRLFVPAAEPGHYRQLLTFGPAPGSGSSDRPTS